MLHDRSKEVTLATSDKPRGVQFAIPENLENGNKYAMAMRAISCVTTHMLLGATCKIHKIRMNLNAIQTIATDSGTPKIKRINTVALPEALAHAQKATQAAVVAVAHG